MMRTLNSSNLPRLFGNNDIVSKDGNHLGSTFASALKKISVPPVNKHLFGVTGLSHAGSQSDLSSASGDEDNYTLVENRRTKRLRANSPPVCSKASASSQLPKIGIDDNAAVQNKTQLKTRIIGSSRNPGGIKTALNIIKKSVFCVGNLTSDCTAEALKEYICSIGVQVDGTSFSCYPAKSNPRIIRKGKKEEWFTDTCFRVCIEARDANLFFNPKNWPENVSLRRWVFKEKAINDGTSRKDENKTSGNESGRVDGSPKQAHSVISPESVDHDSTVMMTHSPREVIGEHSASIPTY